MTKKEIIKDGLVEEFYDNGQLWITGNYKNGKPDGLFDHFYENGQLEYRGNSKNGKQDGLWEYFDESGNLTKTEEWEDGERIK
tara:strand:- start:333 stop:581 length:249 start_codon:yes stop_codon:yes gene_type:complete